MSKHLGTLTLDLVARIGRYVEPLQRAERQTTQSTQNISRQLQVAGQASANFSLQLQDLTTVLKGFIGIASPAIFSQLADGYTELNNKLKLVTNSQQQLHTALNDTFRIAQETASSWESVNDIYSKFAQNAEKLGLSQQKVADLTQTVAKAVGMSGASTAAANASLLQFGQALNTGVLRGVELNSVMSQTPALAKAIAEGMGVAMGDLKRLGEEGKITTEVMINALQKVAPSVEAEYAKTATTVSDSLNRIKNQAIKSIGEFDQQFKISENIVNSISTLANHMETLTITALSLSSVMVGRYVAAMALTAQSTVRNIALKVQEHRQELLNLEIAAQRAARLAQLSAVELANAQAQMVRLSGLQRIAYMERTLLPLQQQHTALLQANTAAQLANNQARNLGAVAGRTLLGVMGGPVGLIATLGTLAGMYALFSKKSDDATQSIHIQTDSVEELIKKYKELNILQQKQVMRDLQQQHDQYSSSIRANSIDLENFLHGLRIFNGFSQQQIDSYQRLTKLYQDGEISLKQYHEAVRQLNILTKDELIQHEKVNERYETSKQKRQELQQRIQSLTQHTNNNTQANQKNAESMQLQTAAMANLTKQQEALQKLQQDTQHQTYLATLIQNGVNPELAQKMADFRQNSGMGYQDKMPAEVMQQIRNNFDAEQKVKDLTTTKDKKASKTSTTSPTIDVVISRGEGHYNSFNRGYAGDSVGQKLNLIAMTLGEIMQRQSLFTNNPNRLFAVGKYQIVPKTMKGAVSALGLRRDQLFTPELQEKIFQQYLVGSKRPSIKKFVQGKGSMESALLELAQEFASVADFRTGKSFYAGKGNNKASISAEKMRNALLAQKQIYQKNLANGMDSESAWRGSFAGQANVEAGNENHVENYAQELQKQAEQQAELQAKIIYQNADKIQQIEMRKKEELAELNKAGFAPQQYQKIKQQIEQRYEKEINLARHANQIVLHEYDQFLLNKSQLIEREYQKRKTDVENDDELNQSQRDQALRFLQQWRDTELNIIQNENQKKLQDYQQLILSEKELLKIQFDEKISMIHAERELSKEQKQQAIEWTNRWYRNEVDKIEKIRQQRMQTIMQEQAILQAQQHSKLHEFYAKSTLNQDAYQQWQHQNQYSDAINQANQQHTAHQNDILAKDENGNFILDETTRHQALQDAEYTHQQNLLNIQAEFAEKRQALQQQQYESQIQSHAMIFSNITGMTKGFFGEQSGIYRAMFAMEKGFAIANAVLAMKQNIAEAMKLGFPANIPMIAAATSQGMAIVNDVRSIMMPSGMAHSGIDYIPSEGTWLLDKGERVLSPRQNRDLTQFLQGNHSGGVVVNQTIHIHGNGESQIEQDKHNAVAEGLKVAMIKVVQNEMRQGGSIYRFVKG